MKKNKIKKILQGILIGIFSLSLVLPLGLSFAQNPDSPLSISADKTSIKVGGSIKIKASIQTEKGGENISYSVSTDNTTSGHKVACTIPSTTTAGVKSCEFIVIFSSKGDFVIDGYYSSDKKNYSIGKNSLTITVEESTGVTLKDNKDITDDSNKDESGEKDTDTNYYPLEGLPGIEKGKAIDTSEACAFGKYLNVIFRLVIGISAVLAVVMIIYGGIEYMSGGAVSEKENGKETITNAILGLVIALGAWLLLNTLNPQLLNVCLDLPEATITINEPDAGDDSVDPDFAKGIKIYSTDATVSSGVTSAITKIKNGWEIVKFTVHTNNKMTIELKKGSEYDYSSVIDVAPGSRGYADVGTAKVGDKKTPLGDWKIIGIKYKPGEAQFNRTGSNMGAAFWHLNPTVSGERGIGMHGNKNGTLGVTNGCIRLKNADILALQSYIKVGMLVSVKK